MRLDEFDEKRDKKLAQYKTAAAADAAKADAEGDFARGDKRFKGINTATKKQFDNDVKKSEVKEVAPPGARAERMVKHIKAGYARDGKLTPKEKGIAFATAWKAHNAGRVEEQGVAEGSYDNDPGIKHTRGSLLAKLEALPRGSDDFEWNRQRAIQHLKQGNMIRAKYYMMLMKRGEQGVAEGSLNEFAPDGFNGGDDGEGFDPDIAKMAQEDGFTKGVSLVDGATLERAMTINYWHSQHGGMYKQYFAKGFKQGRMNKVNHNNKQYNLNLKLMKDGSISHGEQGVAEGGYQDDSKEREENLRYSRSRNPVADAIRKKLNPNQKPEKEQGVAEAGDTAKGQKMLAKVHQRAADRVTSKQADKDPAYARKAQQTQDRAWERLAVKEQGVAEGSIKDVEAKIRTHDQRKADREQAGDPYVAHEIHSHNVIRKQLLDKRKRAQAEYHKKMDSEGVAEGQLDELSRDTLNAYLRKSKNRADDFHAQGEKASMEPGRKAMAKGDQYFDKRDSVLRARRGARDRLKGVFHPKEAPYGAKKADDSDAMQDMAEGHKESYIIVRTDREGKKDVFAGNFDTYEQAQKELDACLAHPLHTKHKQKFEIKRKGHKDITEMDKSQTPPGRDGGPREGPEKIARPITKDNMVNHALNALSKSMAKKDDKKKDVSEDQLDELSKDTLKDYMRAQPARIKGPAGLATTNPKKAARIVDPEKGDMRRALTKLKDPEYGQQGVAEDSIAAMRRLAGIVPQVPTVVSNGQRQYRHMPTAVQPR